MKEKIKPLTTVLVMEHVSKCETAKTSRYLQIPVIDASAMAVVNSVDQLLEIFPRVVLLEPPARSLDHKTQRN
jgi:hypothetical protein